MTLAIVGSSGGMKGVFVQGVLYALEAGGLQAEAYAGASASALPATSAAAKLCNQIGIKYWYEVWQKLQVPGTDLSEVMRNVTLRWKDPTEPFRQAITNVKNMARLILPANYVKKSEAAAQTQGAGHRKLGRKLLIAAARKQRDWVDENLELHLYDTQPSNEHPLLSWDNLWEVAYASTRMIQWRTPAWISGEPYVDASYTCACPAIEMVELGYDEVIAIATELGDVYRDIFADEVIPETYQGAPIRIIRPQKNLKEMGVDFTEATEEGLHAVYAHGQEVGSEFLRTYPR